MKDYRARYLVLTWYQFENGWHLRRATVAHSLRKARQLRTQGIRYPNTRVSIVAEELVTDIGDYQESAPKPTRAQLLMQHLAEVQVRTKTQ